MFRKPKPVKAPWRWPNFTPDEIACKCCGEIVIDERAMDALQAMRHNLGKPVLINSGHRCAFHNARIGGAPLSQHLGLAFDIDLRGHDLGALVAAAKIAGFTGFGYYRNFLHLDTGRKREWPLYERRHSKWKN